MAGAGLLVSGRFLFPGLLGQKREAAHIDGDGRDGLVRVIAPLGGGSLRLLATDARNDVSFATRVPETDTTTPPPRNDLDWSSTSVGAHWERVGGSGSSAITIWRAAGGANARWPEDSLSSALSTGFTDIGLRGRVRRNTPAGDWGLALRVNRRSGDYRVAPTLSGPGSLSLGSKSLLLTVQPDWTGRLSSTHRLALGASASAYRGRGYAAPFAEWTWSPRATLAVAASASRRWQFSQSARNAESVIGNVFPADLSVNAGPSVPVARADQIGLVGEWRPSPTRLLGLRAWSDATNQLAAPPIINPDATTQSGR
jgi:hypothetical protein